MESIFSAIAAAVGKNENSVLVSIIAKSGSAPRGTGAKMLVYENAESIGTIGGGGVEYRSIELSMQAMKEKQSFIHSFKLAPNDAADIGMVCGGDVDVFFQYIQGGLDQNIEVSKNIMTAFENEEDAWLVTEINEDNGWEMCIHSKSRQNIENSGNFFGRNSKLVDKGDKKYLVDPIVSTAKVYLFGGGHISQKLVPILNTVDFNCIVIDDRAEFANVRLFPDAEKIIVTDFSDLEEQIKIKANDYVVILTRGHKNDYDVLSQALKTNACYIGLVGSRTKLGKTRAQLFENGFSQEDFERIYAPIGTNIKAVTPAELAISIAGELIMVRAMHSETIA